MLGDTTAADPTAVEGANHQAVAIGSVRPDAVEDSEPPEGC